MKLSTYKKNQVENKKQLEKPSIKTSQTREGNLMNNSKPIGQGLSEQKTSDNENTPKGFFNYKVPLKDVKNYLDLKWRLGPNSPKVRKEHKKLLERSKDLSKNKSVVSK